MRINEILTRVQKNFKYLKGLKYFKLGIAVTTVAVAAVTATGVYVYHVHTTRYEAPVGYNIYKNTVKKQQPNKEKEKNKGDIQVTTAADNLANNATTNNTQENTSNVSSNNTQQVNKQVTTTNQVSPSVTTPSTAPSKTPTTTPSTPSPSTATSTPAPTPTKPSKADGIDYNLMNQINANTVDQWNANFDNGANPKTQEMIDSAVNIAQGGQPLADIRNPWHTFGSNGGNIVSYKSSNTNTVEHDAAAYYTKFPEGRGFFYAVPYWENSINDYKMIYVTINMF